MLVLLHQQRKIQRKLSNDRKQDRDPAIKTLSTLYTNILKNPNNQKFRLSIHILSVTIYDVLYYIDFKYDIYTHTHTHTRNNIIIEI